MDRLVRLHEREQLKNKLPSYFLTPLALPFGAFALTSRPLPRPAFTSGAFTSGAFPRPFPLPPLRTGGYWLIDVKLREKLWGYNANKPLLIFTAPQS